MLVMGNQLKSAKRRKELHGYLKDLKGQALTTTFSMLARCAWRKGVFKVCKILPMGCLPNKNGTAITACGKLRLLCCPSQHGTTSTTSTGIFGHSHLQHVQRPLAKAENQKTHHFVLHSSHLVYWLREPQGWDGSASQGGANKNGATGNANQSDVESKSAATNQQKPSKTMQARTGQSFFVFCIKSVSLYPLLLLTRPMKSSIR